jgi:hypothetical protein
MQLASLRLRSRVVVQAHLDDDSVVLCASELESIGKGTMLLRVLDDLPADMAGKPVTLLVGGDECLMRVDGLVTEQNDLTIEVEVEEEIEEIQRRRFARLTGWVPVEIDHGVEVSAGTMVDVSLGGAAVLTSGAIGAGESIIVSADSGSGRAAVVGVTALDSGVRRLHLKFEQDDTSAEFARSLFESLAS